MFDALDVGLLSFIMPIVGKVWGLANSQTGLISSVSTIGMICGDFILVTWLIELAAEHADHYPADVFAGECGLSSRGWL